MALKRQRSSLQPISEAKVLYQRDSTVNSAVQASMTISTEPPAAGRLGSIAGVDIYQLIHFEILTQEGARLVFADGTCEIYPLTEVLQLVREKNECDLFQAIALNGQAYECFNIMYTKSFEKIICEEGTYYRARLNFDTARCPAGNSLLHCGTDLFSAHVYSKLYRRLETMDPNNDYSFKRTYKLHPCRCVDAADPEREHLPYE